MAAWVAGGGICGGLDRDPGEGSFQNGVAPGTTRSNDQEVRRASDLLCLNVSSVQSANPVTIGE